MNILLLGSGGREHAFAAALSKSPRCSQLYIAPGNAGTAQCGTNLNASPTDFPALRDIVLEFSISLVVVGPEDPLVNGIVDYFLKDEVLKNIPVIGPSAAGARLEGSKDFSKAFMQKHHIPTAAFKSFKSFEVEEGYQFIDQLNAPYVLKADGLAAGKGVLILNDKDDAKKELHAMLFDSKFGKAGDTVVIEEFLEGIEVSVFVLTDGKNYKILPEAKDYKRIGEGDTGLNTGGMGAVSPVYFADKTFMEKVEKSIVKPTIEGLAADGIDYKGFIFIGLMNVNGEPIVIEYNCRLGDPETEVVLPRIQTDFVELMEAVTKQQLDQIHLAVDSRIATTVMMVSGGYPGNYQTGFPIKNLDKVTDAFVFHAGTSSNGEKIITNGGRVMAVTGMGTSLEEALAKSYAAAKVINFDYEYYRKDIGQDLLKMTAHQ